MVIEYLEDGFSPAKITALQTHSEGIKITMVTRFSAEIYRSCYALLISFISLFYFCFVLLFFSDVTCLHGYEDVILPNHSLIVQDCMFRSAETNSREVSVAWEGQRVLFGGSL